MVSYCNRAARSGNAGRRSLRITGASLPGHVRCAAPPGRDKVAVPRSISGDRPGDRFGGAAFPAGAMRMALPAMWERRRASRGRAVRGRNASQSDRTPPTSGNSSATGKPFAVREPPQMRSNDAPAADGRCGSDPYRGSCGRSGASKGFAESANGPQVAPLTLPHTVLCAPDGATIRRTSARPCGGGVRARYSRKAGCAPRTPDPARP